MLHEMFSMKKKLISKNLKHWNRPKYKISEKIVCFLCPKTSKSPLGHT